MPERTTVSTLDDMTVFRTTAVVTAALFTCLPLTGCGGSSSTPEPRATTPTRSAAVTWANDVCSASATLRTSTEQVGAALQTALSGSATSLDQARKQLLDRVAAVRRSAAALHTALTTAPTGADQQLVAAQQQLRGDSEQARQAVDQLGAAADRVGNAQTAAEIATGLPPLKTSLTSAVTALGTYLGSLRKVLDNSEQSLQNAFGAAPACQGLMVSTTKS
jgi:methyl-accepting chemotaxis protein